MPQPPDHARDLLPDVLQVRLHGHERPHGEHEILPDHQAVGVAGLVEAFRFVQTSRPDADHVEMRLDAGTQQTDDMRLRQPLR